MLDFVVEHGRNALIVIGLLAIVLIALAILRPVLEKRFPPPPNDRISGDW